MKKIVFYTEIAYFLGLILLALGTGMTAFGNFGLSMVVAPAYILHLKLSQFWHWFSFGMAEYVLQGLLLLVIWLALKGKKRTCLLSFTMAVLYGFLLDGAMALVGMLEYRMWIRVVVYVLGVVFCTSGVSLLFHSYLPPAAYEFMALTVANRYHKKVTLCKTVYDCMSLVVSVALSLLLFGKILGVGIGTVICALIYGTVIGMFGKLWDRLFTFHDRFAYRQKLQ